LTSFAPKIRVEVYVPIRHEPAYKETLSWVIEEFTQLRGGCTVSENLGGYYLSRNNKVIEDRVSMVYSDFPMNWEEQAERTDVLDYCASLQEFLLENLWEEEILIGAYPVSHLKQEVL
jgi:hypothetical protein